MLFRVILCWKQIFLMRGPLKILFLLLTGTGFLKAEAQTCTMVISDTNLCEGATTLFSVTVSGGNTPIVYNWNFGDGFLASTAAPGHTYTVPGNYQPTVTVSFGYWHPASVHWTRIDSLQPIIH